MGTKDLQVTAILPTEIQQANASLIDWCDKKILSVESDLKEVQDGLAQAKKNHWGLGRFQRLITKEENRIVFYQKMREALKHGFVIVPNMPVELFLIRTKKKSPTGTSTYFWTDHQQSAQLLPSGEGEYQNPLPVVHREKETTPDGTLHAYSQAEDWAEFEFPITMMKPQIIDATNRAMDLKIFDQFGVLPKTKKEDPIIVGQILFRNGPKWNTKVLSFMIAWHFDTNILP